MPRLTVECGDLRPRSREEICCLSLVGGAVLVAIDTPIVSLSTGTSALDPVLWLCL